MPRNPGSPELLLIVEGERDIQLFRHGRGNPDTELSWSRTFGSGSTSARHTDIEARRGDLETGLGRSQVLGQQDHR